MTRLELVMATGTVGAMGRAEALAGPHAEPLLNGRCVGHVELDERYGTVLVMDWHDPDGCEHVAAFECRDIGYGVEVGSVLLPALGGPDWTGKREYRSADGATVYLFDDEIRGA